MSPRRRSSTYGGPPLGLDPGGLRVDGLRYHEIKHRLGLIEPPMPGPVTAEQAAWVGAGLADLSRPRHGGWCQPEALSVWSPRDLLDEYEAVDDGMMLLLTSSTVDRLTEAEEEL